MELIRNIEDFTAFVKVDKTMKYASLEPYIPIAESKYIARHTGLQLLADLKQNMVSQTPNNHLTVLLPFVQRALAHFTLYVAGPDLDIKVQEMGFQTAQNDNMLPASAARVERFMKNRLMLGYAAIEQMLQYLEANKQHFAQWEQSEGRTIFNDLLIRTADEFDQIVNIERSSLTFYNYRQHMTEAQTLTISGEITEEYLSALISRRNSGSLTSADTTVLKLAQRSLAYLTAAKAAEDPVISRKLHSSGMEIIGQAKRIMWANPSNFPEFQNSPSYFQRTDFQRFENNGENSFFMFGSN